MMSLHGRGAACPGPGRTSGAGKRGRLAASAGLTPPRGPSSGSVPRVSPPPHLLALPVPSSPFVQNGLACAANPCRLRVPSLLVFFYLLC